MADQKQQQDLEYLSLDGIVTEKSTPWDGHIHLLPPGDYPLEIKQVEKDQSQNDNPVLRMTYEVFEGDHKGETVKKSYALTQKAIGRLLNVFKAVGLELDSKSGFRPRELIGKRLIATITEELRDGDPNPMTGEKTTRKGMNVVAERMWGQVKNANAGANKSGRAPETRA